MVFVLVSMEPRFLISILVYYSLCFISIDNNKHSDLGEMQTVLSWIYPVCQLVHAGLFDLNHLI